MEFNLLCRYACNSVLKVVNRNSFKEGSYAVTVEKNGKGYRIIVEDSKGNEYLFNEKKWCSGVLKRPYYIDFKKMVDVWESKYPEIEEISMVQRSGCIISLNLE